MVNSEKSRSALSKNQLIKLHSESAQMYLTGFIFLSSENKQDFKKASKIHLNKAIQNLLFIKYKLL